MRKNAPISRRDVDGEQLVAPPRDLEDSEALTAEELGLDAERYYRALKSRDARFDGRFFIGVTSTGVFCRPICPARTPKRENIRLYACAAAAEASGFRPCLRCRPEASPGTPAWLGTSATVSRALRHIEGGALDRGSVEELAGRLGIGDRQLRRLFLDHLGASPVAVAQTRRLLFAKKLINETDLPMTSIAFDSGYSSLRRFNSAVKQVYGTSPSELRRRRRSKIETTSKELVLKLAYRAPFAWSELLAFLEQRTVGGVEWVGDDAYYRTVVFGDAIGVINVSHVPERNQLALRVPTELSAHLAHIVERVRRIFDLGADPYEIATALGKDRDLGPRIKKVPGLRVPGAWSGLETGVRAILGQQVTVKGATTLISRLVGAFGTPLPEGAANGHAAYLTHTFPTAERLADADVATIGIPKARANAVRELARAMLDERVRLDEPIGLEETVASLEALPGIGRWTAEYISMRVLGEPDAFPAGDLVLRRVLTRDEKKPSERELRALSEAWRPWRAYAVLYLWSVNK
jgi:AraC family transcriptional regulator of adaptative response / DNA-3-methyladenine glycosylase II